MKEIVTDKRHIPEPVKTFEYWVVWDWQVKQPRAPWLTDNCYRTKWGQDSGQNPRTEYKQAAATSSITPEELDRLYGFPDDPPERVGPTLCLPHEGKDTPGPDLADPPLLFIDYDDVIVDGEIPDEVWETAKVVGGPLFVSTSYFDAGSDTAGLHQLARGELPGDLLSIPHSTEFDDRGHIEVYKRSRMTGFTWQHVRGTPLDDLPDATNALVDIIERYGTEQTKRRASGENVSVTTPESDIRDKAELSDMDITEEITDVYDAVSQIGPRDIRLYSEQTESGHRESWHPDWVPESNSDSMTRLGYFDGHFFYRPANQPVDALQVVAREEGITTDVTEYPSGMDYWKAVQRLRDRGASIPLYLGEDGTHPDYVGRFRDANTKEERRRQALRQLR